MITKKVTDDKYRKYLGSKKWRSFRKSVIKKRKFCELCGKNKNLQVHHLTYKILYKERRWGNWNYVLLVCKDCHYMIHHSGQEKYIRLDPKRYRDLQTESYKWHNRRRAKAVFKRPWIKWFI